MKTNKLLIIILAVTIAAMAVCSVALSIALKPTVTEGEFPFSVTYELDGEVVTINDVCVAYYDGNDGYANTKERVYVGKIGDMEENNSVYFLREQDGYGSLELHLNLYADYLMGDPEYDYFDDEAFEPEIIYFDSEGQGYTDEETLAAQGVKLISWEYPTPIENTLVFSHISIFSGVVVVPTLLIGLVALVVTMIFVKKDSDYVRKPVDILSTVLNFLICFIPLPFFTVASVLMDITDINEDLLSQMFYFVPALTILGIVASVGLRRKGKKISSLLVQFAGPVAFAVIYILFGVMELL